MALSDVFGAIYNPDGFDCYDVDKFVKETGSVVGYPGSKAITNAELLAMKVTVLAPCAMELQITAENAEAVLDAKGVFVVPDILANGGGVTVSYFEWVQNLYRYFWSEEEVIEKQTAMMIKAFKEVHAKAEQYGVDMRVAAYIVALASLVEAMKIRGMF